MNKYQLLFIIDNDIEDEAKDAVIDKFSNLIAELGGTVGMLDKWGTRKYAYPIIRFDAIRSYARRSCRSRQTDENQR